MNASLFKSTDGKHKYKILLQTDKGYKIIEFGLHGYHDYTTYPAHQEKIAKEHKALYLLSHRNENWTYKGIYTRGFWSRWLCWNKRTLKESIEKVQKKFNITVIL